MKKRLHYAMPRVPLHKLKPNIHNTHEIFNDESRSHVDTIAKRIQNAKLERRQSCDLSIPDDAENMSMGGESDSSDQTSSVEDTDSSCFSESEGETNIEGHNEMPQGEVGSTTDGPDMFEVTADIHNEFATGGDEAELEGAVGGVREEDFTWEQTSHPGEVFEMPASDHMTSESLPESDHFKTSEFVQDWIGRLHNKQKVNTNKEEKGEHFIANITDFNEEKMIQWGEEESSDSEGGWDFETGGMPLLPR